MSMRAAISARNAAAAITIKRSIQMSVKIYTMTHKKFDVPNDPMYVPLQVGAEGKEPLGYVSDNTGENISALNCYYSELTGVYWIWKRQTL